MVESYHFEGEFPPHWLGNLAGHLSTHGIDVDAVNAHLGERGVWRISVRLRSELPPSEKELAAMARLNFERTRAERGPLSRYLLVRETSGLYLSIRAEDRRGFLAQLCADLAAHALFPVRVEAQCDEGQINDSLWLKGIGHAVPHQETEASFRRFLATWESGNLRSSMRPPSR